MALKRDIRKELEARTWKDVLKYVKRTIKTLYLVNRKRFLIISILEIITNTIAPIITLFVLQAIINGIIEKEFLIKYFIAWAVLIVFNRVLIYFRERAEANYVIDIRLKAEKSLCQKKVDLRIEDYENKELHNNSERADSGTMNIISLFRSGKTLFVSIISFVSYAVIIVTWKFWLLPLLLIAPLVDLIITSRVLKENYIRRWELSETRRKVRYYSLVLRQTPTLSEVKVLNVDGEALKKFNYNAEKIAKEMQELETNFIDQRSKVRIVDKFVYIGYFLLLVLEAVNGRITIGTFNTLNTSFGNVSSKSNNVTKLLLHLNVWLLEAKEYFDFLDYDNGFVDGTKIIDKLETIEFKNVSYTYKQSKDPAVYDINFKINKKEKIAFIGENGSGKTTIMKLLTKVYIPTEGEILINDININEYRTDSIRSKITMLMQDFNLFEETVAENITLTQDKQSPEAIYNKMPFNDLKDRIGKLPNKLDTILGSWFGDGINLSKGQLQMLALSRIFYKDCDCYILDEPNSALDPRSEKYLFEYIQKKLKDKMCIITLHVFTNIDITDRVLMFEKGKIICEGHHLKLYKENEKYQEFYNLQERTLEENK